jgi:hypothetical protein
MKLIVVAVAALSVWAAPAVSDLAASSPSSEPAVVVAHGSTPQGGDSGWGG